MSEYVMLKRQMLAQIIREAEHWEASEPEWYQEAIAIMDSAAAPREPAPAVTNGPIAWEVRCYAGERRPLRFLFKKEDEAKEYAKWREGSPNTPTIIPLYATPPAPPVDAGGVDRAIRKIRARADSTPPNAHGKGFIDGLRCAANMMERAIQARRQQGAK